MNVFIRKVNSTEIGFVNGLRKVQLYHSMLAWKWFWSRVIRFFRDEEKCLKCEPLEDFLDYIPWPIRSASSQDKKIIYASGTTRMASFELRSQEHTPWWLTSQENN